jgi:hypothetical protein
LINQPQRPTQAPVVTSALPPAFGHLEDVLRANGIRSTQELKIAIELASEDGALLEQHEFWRPLLREQKISRLDLFRLKKFVDDI